MEIKVFDLEKNVVPGVNVVYATKENKPVGIILNNEGEGNLKITKEQNEVNLQFTNVSYQPHQVNLKSNFSYLLEVFLAEDGKDIPIEVKQEVFTVEDLEEDTLKLRDKKGEVSVWKRR